MTKKCIIKLVKVTEIKLMENGSKLKNANEVFTFNTGLVSSYLTKSKEDDKILAVLPEVKANEEPSRILSSSYV